MRWNGRCLGFRTSFATSTLWPDIERVYPWVHKAAHILSDPAAEDAATVRRRFDGLVGAMALHRDSAGSLNGAIDHFCKVTRSYRPGLFHCYAVSDLPRTNNDLEHEFGSQRYHERRATGRKTASPVAVLRGEARMVAAVGTRQHAPSGAELGTATVPLSRTSTISSPSSHIRSIEQP